MKPLALFWGVVTLAAISLAAAVGYRVVFGEVAAAVYRDRLENLAREYEDLRSHYNEAVRRTAVNELVVQDGRVSVRVRNLAGVVAEVPTPYDPSGEIYVDYVVIDGRLWLRRIFDNRTPPREGIVIEPSLADIDWSDPGAAHGKAVYRRLGEGRWVVTVTGDGSLGLARADGDEPRALAFAPEVREYGEITAQAAADIDRIGMAEVVRRFVGGR